GDLRAASSYAPSLRTLTSRTFAVRAQCFAVASLVWQTTSNLRARRGLCRTAPARPSAIGRRNGRQEPQMKQRKSADPAKKKEDAIQSNAPMQGEGNYTAGRRYDKAQHEFVKSGQVDDAAREAAPRTP